MDVGGKRDGNCSAVWNQNCYFMWLWRNKHEHKDDFIRPLKPWEVILKACDEYSNGGVVHVMASGNTSSEIMIGWKPPLVSWVAINTDGAARGQGRWATSGGPIRVNDGRWICGFAKQIGSTTAYVAELWEVSEWLRLAHSRGVKFIN